MCTYHICIKCSTKNCLIWLGILHRHFTPTYIRVHTLYIYCLYTHNNYIVPPTRPTQNSLCCTILHCMKYLQSTPYCIPIVFSGVSFGGQKRNFDEIDRSGFDRFIKKNFDEIDRSGFDRFIKKNFDEIDRSAFSSFVKRPSKVPTTNLE